MRREYGHDTGWTYHRFFSHLFLTSSENNPRRCHMLVRATCCGLPGCLRPLRTWHLADSSISCEDELAGAQGSLFEVLCIGRKNLPPRYLRPKHLDRSHTGEVSPQTLVVLFGGGEPHSVVGRLAGLVFISEDEDDLVCNIDGEAAEHGASPRRQRPEGVEHKFMRHRLPPLDGKDSVVQRKNGRFASGLRHTQDTVAVSLSESVT